LTIDAVNVASGGEVHEPGELGLDRASLLLKPLIGERQRPVIDDPWQPSQRARAVERCDGISGLSYAPAPHASPAASVRTARKAKHPPVALRP
jgi:hypothetical protein